MHAQKFFNLGATAVLAAIDQRDHAGAVNVVYQNLKAPSFRTGSNTFG